MSVHGHSFHKKDWALLGAGLATAGLTAGAAGAGPLAGLLGGTVDGAAAGGVGAGVASGAAATGANLAEGLGAGAADEAVGSAAGATAANPLTLGLHNAATMSGFGSPGTQKALAMAGKFGGLLGQQQSAPPQMAPMMPRGGGASTAPLPYQSSPIGSPIAGAGSKTFDPQVYASLSPEQQKQYLAMLQGGFA